MKSLLIAVLTLCLMLGVAVNVFAEAQMPAVAGAGLGSVQLNPLVVDRSSRVSPEFLEAVNFDQDGRGDAFPNKLGDGVLNIATCWTDVPRQINQVSEERNIIEGYTLGFGEGILSGIARGVSGTYDAATFILPPYDEPMMQPQYAVSKPNEEGFKVKLLTW